MSADVRKQLDDLLATRILVLDGAMGTMIQRHEARRRPISAARGSPATRTI